MTVCKLYGIIIELMFGNKNIVYIVTDSFATRKALGPVLSTLLHTHDIVLTTCTPTEWTIVWEGQEKYLRFTTGVTLTPAERQYSSKIFI